MAIDIHFMKRPIAKLGDERMKFFTRELYIQYNSADRAQADEASQRWEREINGYHQHVKRIKNELPPGARTLSTLCLHDAELIHPKPGASLPRGLALVAVALRQKDQQWTVYLITYLLAEEARTHPAAAKRPFSKKRVHWLYDELDRCPGRKGCFVHRVLFSDGAILEIPFTDASVQTISMRAASLRDFALKSA